MYSKIKVIADHGHFREGEVLDVLDIIPHIRWPRKVQYFVVVNGNTIPRENVEWV